LIFSSSSSEFEAYSLTASSDLALAPERTKKII